MPERDGTRIAGRVLAGCIGALIVPAGPAWLVGSAGRRARHPCRRCVAGAMAWLRRADLGKVELLQVRPRRIDAMLITDHPPDHWFVQLPSGAAPVTKRKRVLLVGVERGVGIQARRGAHELGVEGQDDVTLVLVGAGRWTTDSWRPRRRRGAPAQGRQGGAPRRRATSRSNEAAERARENLERADKVDLEVG